MPISEMCATGSIRTTAALVVALARSTTQFRHAGASACLGECGGYLWASPSRSPFDPSVDQGRGTCLASMRASSTTTTYTGCRGSTSTSVYVAGLTADVEIKASRTTRSVARTSRPHKP